MDKTTKRIDPSAIEGKKPIAKGYKIFDYKWCGQNDYCYADDNGNVEGTVHTVTGELDMCSWGLHFSKNPLDCLEFKELIQWNRFAELEAYYECIDNDEGTRSICRTLRIVKVLIFDQMIDLIKSTGNVSDSGICDSSGISNGHGICDSSGISNGHGICDSSGISNGFGICDGHGIYGGHNIYGGYGIYNSKYCRDCEGISRCILCYHTSGKLMIFNKPVTEDRDRKSTRLNSSHVSISYAVFCLKKKTIRVLKINKKNRKRDRDT